MYTLQITGESGGCCASSVLDSTNVGVGAELSAIAGVGIFHGFSVEYQNHIILIIIQIYFGTLKSMNIKI